MKPAVQLLITLCLLVIRSNFISVVGDESLTLEPSADLLTSTAATQEDGEAVTTHDDRKEVEEKTELKSEQRSIDFHGSLDSPMPNEDRHAAFRKRAKPLKNIFLGMYKNYKSTYLGNKTLTEYRNAMRTRKEENLEHTQAADNDDDKNDDDDGEENDESTPTSASTVAVVETETTRPNDQEAQKSHANIRLSKRKRNKQRLAIRNRLRTKKVNANNDKRFDELKLEKSKNTSAIFQYDFGHGYNMSLDMDNDIVNLHLDGESLRKLMQGRSFEGRGKKYEMITRVLPLFILPFLIQSAVVPFLVTKLKLLLMKSILVGKLAIFLLIISAIKNSNKMMQTYEVAPSYWAGEPSRRSELAAAASAAAYNGYRVEGKPAAWIN